MGKKRKRLKAKKWREELERLWSGGKDTHQDKWGGMYTGMYGRVGKICNHAPIELVTGNGWSAWAASRAEAVERLHGFDILLNCTGMSIHRTHKHRLPRELRQYIEDESYKGPLEILLDWDDYGDINLMPQFWDELITYMEKRRGKLLIFCNGGHGRTGTAVACMLIAACKHKPSEAIKWIRKHYCTEAIESRMQEAYIRRVGKFFGLEDPPLPVMNDILMAPDGQIRDEDLYREWADDPAVVDERVSDRQMREEDWGGLWN